MKGEDEKVQIFKDCILKKKNLKIRLSKLIHLHGLVMFVQITTHAYEFV